MSKDYVGCFMDGSSSRLFELKGDANQDADYGDAGGFGLSFDGNGDYAIIKPQDYANDGTFSLSFWFTK